MQDVPIMKPFSNKQYTRTGACCCADLMEFQTLCEKLQNITMHFAAGSAFLSYFGDWNQNEFTWNR